MFSEQLQQQLQELGHVTQEKRTVKHTLHVLITFTFHL